MTSSLSCFRLDFPASDSFHCEYIFKSEPDQTSRKAGQDSSSEEHTQTHSSPTRHQEMMKMLLGHSLCLLLLLSRLGELVESRALHLDSCSVNVHTQELRKYYSTMRSNLIAADGEVAVKIVSKSLIKNVQDGQMCCFLRLVLRFYVERVFSNYASAQPQDQRCSSALANAFVSIRKEINKCHCHCAEETQRTVDSLHAEFIKKTSAAYFTGMTPRSLLLSALVLLSFFITVWTSPVCVNKCCRFVEDFPVRLKTLRLNYAEIRDFYEANDDLDTALLDQSVEETFKTPFACHAINSILDFYLATVLPGALAGVTEDTKSMKPHMESIQQIFDQLKNDVTACRHYFHCKNQFDITNLNSTYTQMQSKGLYKAMGELNLLFNYIETYLASKRHRNHV
ncbi:Interleukin-10 [Larimichthys crocea]|uniref:Interleukin family protein n=1 Tax=Larimichthys crocea TaxID=215358 RepID=A0A6G0J587_LARCR|nr:Interleukin-10 [Larimichthys crocea]